MARRAPMPTTAGAPARKAMLVALAAWAASGVAGCEPERRVVKYKPFFTGLPGAEFGTQPVLPPELAAADPDPSEELVTRQPDGTKKILSRSMRELIYHIHWTMDENDLRTLADEVLSDELKRELRQQGRTPEGYAQDLKNAQADVDALLLAFPQGEATPGAVFERVGERQFRLYPGEEKAENLELTELYVVMEKGQWKLLWLQ